MRPAVTVIEPEGPESWFNALESVAGVSFFYPDGPISAADVDRILAASDGVIVTSATAISDGQLERAARLKIIAKCGGPPSNIDPVHAARCGIAVSCSPGANTTSIAEYTVMLIIAVLRRFDLHLDAIRRGTWRAPGFLLGHDLRDATIGIIGYGAIGSAVARFLRAFGCRVLVYSPHAKDCRVGTDDLSVRFCDSLEELLPQCDVVTLHRKVTPETVRFFNARCFALMKPGAAFINTARGVLVNEDDLADALTKGHLSAAAVDVFRVEPPSPDSPLLACENAILTPHSSGWTEEALRRECDGAVASVLAYFNGRPIPGLLNGDYANHLCR